MSDGIRAMALSGFPVRLSLAAAFALVMAGLSGGVGAQPAGDPGVCAAQPAAPAAAACVSAVRTGPLRRRSRTCWRRPHGC